jgi:hypothetical protein
MSCLAMNQTNEIESRLRAYVCVHVCDYVRPVLLVTRAGGPWCFLCGDLHPQDASSYRVVGIGHLFERDPSLVELKDLPIDWEAERQDVKSPWIRKDFDGQ